MQKYKAKKEVIEQITSKLKNAENRENKGELGEISSISDDISKLQANKNIFARSDFDEYKISDEELAEHNKDIEKGYSKTIYVTKGKRAPYSYVRNFDGVEGKQDKKGKKEKESLITKDVEKLKNFIIDYRNKMSKAEKNNIDKIIKTGNWTKVKTSTGKIVKVDSYKWHDMEKEPLEWEIKNASVLADRGFNVYLPKEIHNIQHYKNIDAIVNGVQVEFRYINTSNKKTLQSKYREKLKQNPHVSFYFNEKAKKDSVEYINTLNGTQSKNPKGILIYYFENTKEFRVYDYKMEIKKAVLSTALDRPEISPSALSLLGKTNKLSSKISKSLTYSGHKLQGRTKLYGMDISIENKKGSYRSGVDSDGHKWKCLMHYDYGYIRGTVGTDGDHLDVYVGPAKDSNKVYVIHQNNPVTHKYDEDKCMLCFESADAAKKGYMKQYDRPGFFGSMDILTIDEFKSYVFSHLGKRIHKSFDVTITDITENNKKQKLEQVQKSLNAIANNRPFVIKHIDADNNSKKYDEIVLRITNFDRNKIEKAVHKIALTLDTELPAKGEAFNFKAQEELTYSIVNELTKKSNMVYSFLIDYFDLPEIRIVSKAKLKYEGKVLYNPETGKPIDTKDWKNFVQALEKFLNRNYDGIGKKIVLSAETLGRILAKLSKTHTLDAIKKMPLKELEINHRKFDWISQTAMNMKDAFGESVSRDRAARIQVAIDSAAVKVTKVTDNMRNDIQQIIIDGVKNKESKSQVSQKLFDKCVGLNRDFQRIADTEIQNTVNNAYIKEEVYNTKEGEKVYFKRYEILDDNTCKKCKKIKGAVALWSDIALGSEKIVDPYSDYAIWEGKESGDVPMGTMHPYCYSDDTEVMTNNGWKLFKDVLDDDLIMSINPETYEIDFVPFINRIQYQYNGEMIHFPGRNFDMLVTPNHNMLIEERKSGKWHGVKAEDLIDKTIYQIPRARGLWNGFNSEKIKIGCVEYSYIQYIKLWAWYLSEGSGRKKSDNAYEIKLAQKNINKILDDIPEFSERFVKGKEALYCTGKIAEMFEQMFGVYAADKYIPDFIKNSSTKCIRAFLYSFNLGDGSKRNRENIKNNSLGIKKSNDFVVRTSSKKMADDLCELIIKAGWMPSIHVTKQKGKEVMFRNGTYKLNTDCYVINICKSKNKVYSKHVHPGHPESHLPYKLNYSGMVYDVELEKWHFLLVKRNGKCGWSGNCRGSWYRYYPDADK